MYWMCVFLSVLAVTHHIPTAGASEDPNGEQISDSSLADHTEFAEMLRKLDPAKLQEIMKELNGGGNKCYQKFDHTSNQVIRPKDSMHNGATFLGVREEKIGVKEKAVDCVQACCDHPSKTCDLALYKENKTDTSHCYLFKCYNEKLNKNACLFSNSSLPYAIFTRRHNIEDSLEELQETANAQVVETTTAPSTTAIKDVAAMDELKRLNDIKQDVPLPEEKQVETATTAHELSKLTTNMANKSHNYMEEEVVFVEVPDAADTAILPLALGLAVTMMVLVMVICRIHIMKKKLKQGRGKYMKMKMDESDYLINGMYL